MSLRSSPIVENATLPGGGSVEIWVGVPDDPYIARCELTTVDIQLREGTSVIASMSTVLDPDETHAALELAREVRGAIERGAIGLTAESLEPFADKLREP